MNKQATLHYVYDPFCGWCYGLAPLVSAADEAGLRVVPHSSGMLAGERAQNMSAEWRDFVRPHEERITALSGQAFFEQTQALLEEIGGRGYPALAIEQDGKISRLRLGRYFGKPELFKNAMEEALAK